MGRVHTSLYVFYIIFSFSTLRISATVEGAVENGLIISQLPNLFSAGSLTTLPGNIDTFETTSVFPVRYFNFHQTTEIVSLATDAHEGVLYLLDGNTRSLYKMENFNVWLNDSSQSVSLIHEGISKTSSKLAFDWLTKNIYWTDEFYNWIAVQPTNTSDPTMFRVLIQSEIMKPLAIAVDPIAGYMFWSDHGLTSGKIERTALDGTDRTVIVTGTVWVPDMALDIDNQKVYWIDIQRNTVECADYNGKNRHVIRRSKFTTVSMSGITVYKNLVCVTEYHSYLVTCLDKETGSNVWMRYFRSKTPWAISVFDKNTQKVVQHGCQSKVCQHFCVNTPSGSQCICKSGYRLKSDGVNCEAAHHLYSRGIFISNKTSICELDVRVITSLAHKPICVLNGQTNIHHLAAAANSDHSLFYIDGQRNELVMFDLYTNKTTDLAKVGEVSGITFDWLDRNVYWSEVDTNSIRVVSLETKISSHLVDVENPTYITLCPYHNSLFVISEANNSTPNILSITFDGKSVKPLINSSRLEKPSGLFYNVAISRLFWIDGGIVHSVTHSGGDFTSYFTVRMDTNLLAYKNYLLTTTMESELHTAYLGSTRVDVTVELEGFGALTGLTVYDPAIQRSKKGPCESHNGHCEHICIPKNGSKTCLCGYGYKQREDGQTCYSVPMKNNFLLAVDFTHQKIYQISSKSTKLAAVDIKDENYPARGLIHQKSSEIYWTDYGTRQIRKSGLDGKKSTVIYNAGSYTPFGMAIDYSTGLMYFTVILPGLNSTSYIGVVDPKTDKSRKLLTDLAASYSVVVHPAKGWMFWSDNGDVPYIGRSSMDGTDKVVLVSARIRQISGLAIDYKEERIYWTDGLQDKIEYSDFSGATRQILLKDSEAHLANLVVSGKNVYYTAINRQHITKVDKTNGYKEFWMESSFQYGRLESVDIYPADEQPLNQYCALNNGGCSQFCLPTPIGYECACDEGITMTKDRHTCLGDTKMQLRQLSLIDDTHLGNTGAIAGGVTAGVVIILIIIVVAAYIMYRKRRSLYTEHFDTPNVRFAHDQGVVNPACAEDNKASRNGI